MLKFPRVTTCVVLNDNGFNETDIIKVTGHKSTTSLKSYNNRATTSQKRQMSDAINMQMCKKTSIENKENVPTCSTSDKIPIIECDDLQELNDNEMCNVVANYEKKAQNLNVQGMFGNCVFNNVTFNININK